MSRKRHPSAMRGSVNPLPPKPSTNSVAFSELLALFHWDERFRKAWHRAEADYIAAGSPPIPLCELNYRKKFKAKNKPDENKPDAA